MSRLLISLSPDLKRLRDEGYDIKIIAAHLVVDHVPYVSTTKEVKFGRLISALTLAGDVTAKPGTHVVHFAGEHPCDRDGKIISQISHQSGRTQLGADLISDHAFSNRPRDGYSDYYAKMTRYIEVISNPAISIDSKVTARIYPLHFAEDASSPFQYLDTASSRAQIGAVTRKFEGQKVAIIGTGGTGSYILDLVAKTPVREIHLFDGDVFSQHNAFRAPGAASKEDLERRLFKVDYLREIYSKIHKGIVSHPRFMQGGALSDLAGFDFVFLCLDVGSAKQGVVEKLEAEQISFVDVGMGVQIANESLHGIVRVTLSTPDKRDHLRQRVSFEDGGGNNEYDKNIQVADLNALNAALAVIRWKKHIGFYADLDKEYFSAYTIDGNSLINGDNK